MVDDSVAGTVVVVRSAVVSVVKRGSDNCSSEDSWPDDCSMTSSLPTGDVPPKEPVSRFDEGASSSPVSGAIEALSTRIGPRSGRGGRRPAANAQRRTAWPRLTHLDLNPGSRLLSYHAGPFNVRRPLCYVAGSQSVVSGTAHMPSSI